MKDNRSVIAIFIIALIALTAWTAWFEWQNREKTVDAAYREVAARAEAFGGALSSTFDVVDMSLTVVKSDINRFGALDGVVLNSLQDYIERLNAAIHQMRALVVFNAKGDVVFDSTTWPPYSVNVFDRDYFQHFFANWPQTAGDAFVGTPALGRTSGTWFLSMARALQAEDGAFNGVVLAVIDVGVFRKFLQEEAAQTGMSVALTTMGGVVIEALTPETAKTWTGRELRELPGFSIPLNEGLKRGVVDAHGRLTATRQVSDLPIAVVISASWDEIMNEWLNRAVRDLVMLVGVIVVLIFVWRPVSRAIRDRDRLFILSPDPICILDAQGRFYTINPAWEALLGRPKATVVGRPILDFVLAKDRKPLQDVLIRLSAGEKIEEFTVAFVNTKGAAASLSIEAVTNQKRIFAIGRNVTRRIAAEEALRKSEQRFRDVAEASGEFIWEVDERHGLVFVTERARSALGWRPERLSGRRLSSLLIGGDRDRVTAAMRRGGPFQYDVTAAREDGAQVALRLSGVPVTGADGSVIGYRGAALDITEGQKARQALLDSEARFRSIVNTVVDGIIMMNDQGEIHSINPAGEAIFGYPAKELIGRHIRRLIGGGESERDEDYIHNALLRGADAVLGPRRDVTGLRRNGDVFALEIGVNEVWLEARKFYIAVCRNIAERKRMERMKDEFVSTVSHELRTPLTSIRGALGLIQGGATGAVPEKARKLVGIALTNCDRLVTLVNDILDMQRIKAGRLNFDMRPIDLRAVLSRAAQETAAFAEEYAIRLTYEPPETPLTIHGDFDRLVQVATNLLSNAIKFSPKGGVVRIEAGGAGGEARFSIIDHGPGVPQDFRERIFQKFSQADATDTRGRDGTGLGLSIVKGIAGHHDGRVWFEDNSEGGAIFTVALPCAGPPGDRNDVATPPSLQDAGAQPLERILIIEDDRDVAHLLKTMLERNGFETVVARDGDEARAALEAQTFAAATLDLMVAHRDGPDLMECLKRDGAIGDPPLIVVSATAREDRSGKRRLEGRALTVADWLRKPVDGEKLRACVRRLTPARARRAKALHIEGDRDRRDAVSRLLSQDIDVIGAGSVAAARRLLEAERRLDLVVFDMRLAHGRGEDLFAAIHRHPGAPKVVIVSADDGETKDEPADSAAALGTSRIGEEELTSVICDGARSRRGRPARRATSRAGATARGREIQEETSL